MLEMPNWIRVEIRWNTITASDATDWPFSQNGKLRPVFQDEATRPANLPLSLPRRGISVVLHRTKRTRRGQGAGVSPRTQIDA